MINRWNNIKIKNNYAALEEEYEYLLSKICGIADRDELRDCSQQLSKINKQLENKRYVESKLEELDLLKSLSKEDKDFEEEYEQLEKDLFNFISKLELESLLSGEYDSNSAFVTLHAGEGGTEAQDWVSMLARMYARWGERNGYKVAIVDSLDGDVAGLKSITLEIKGDYAFGFLRGESGAHRLVRVSPFDSQGRRHTSFAAVEVMPELENINPDIVKLSDCEIQTFRSGGPGGQHQNKTESGVRLIHQPTGLIAECREERSQTQNREKALKMLQGKMIERALEEKKKEAAKFANEDTAGWGYAIRSYVFMPYQLVKDVRSGYETGNITGIMDGDLNDMMKAYLAK